MKKQDLKANLIISGPIFPEPVQVMMTYDMGHLVKVIGKGLRTDKFYDPILDSDQLNSITASPEKEPFDGDPVRFRLGSFSCDRQFRRTCSPASDPIQRRPTRSTPPPAP